MPKEPIDARRPSALRSSQTSREGRARAKTLEETREVGAKTSTKDVARRRASRHNSLLLQRRFCDELPMNR